MNPSSLEWSPEEIRRLGYAVVDAVVDRWANLRESEPARGAPRSELAPRFDEPCPAEGRPIDEVLKRAVEDITPLALQVDHPRFFAFVPSSPAWPSVMGDWLAAGSTIFQGTWLGSAGPSQIELTVLDWFRDWLDLPEGASGLFTSGGSAANLIAVVAAREAAGHPEDGVAYIGEQSHSSVARALRIAGFHEDRIRHIPGDADYRMTPEAIRRAVEADRAAGRTPVLVAANGGATNTGAVDPLDALADLARDEGLWFHVDAAYGGFAALTEEGRAALVGLGRADSVTLDPHKWLFQTFEAGCLMVRDPALLTDVFRVMPEYLQDTDLGMEQVNFADRGLQLTRSFRALKVWMTVQAYGRNGLAAAVEGGIHRARVVEQRVRAADELELLSEASIGIVCFRAVPSDERRARWESSGDDRDWDTVLDDWNRTIQDRVVGEGTAMMSSTRLQGRFSLRMCPMNYRSTDEDVIATVQRIQELSREIPLRA